MPLGRKGTGRTRNERPFPASHHWQTIWVKKIPRSNATNKTSTQGYFPGGPVVKTLPSNARQAQPLVGRAKNPHSLQGQQAKKHKTEAKL